MCTGTKNALRKTTKELPYTTKTITITLLMHYATNRQVVGSIPDGVIGIFQ
jgi:hypothetical protein